MSRINLFFFGMTVGFMVAVVMNSYGVLLTVQEVMK